jgi:hypothetical protein
MFLCIYIYKVNVLENRYKKVLASGKLAFLKEQYKLDKEEKTHMMSGVDEVAALMAMAGLGRSMEEEGDEESDEESDEDDDAGAAGAVE